jgi:hypothetical protein
MGAVIGTASLAACGDSDNGVEPVAGIDIALSAQTLTLGRNASAAVEVVVSRVGEVTGAVGITASGAPAGVDVTATPPSIAPGSTSSTLTIIAGPTAALGAATLTVHATAPGLAEQTETFALIVRDAPAGGTTAWEFCRPTDVPIWFAVQDGSGDWMRITPSATRFEFEVSSGRGGVAYVSSEDFDPADTTAILPYIPGPAGATASSWATQNEALTLRAPRSAAPVDDPSPPRYDLVVVYGTQPELAARGLEQCRPPNRVSGSVADLGVHQFVAVTLGTSTTIATKPTFELTAVPDGAVDLIASRTTVDPSTDEEVVDRLIVRRGLSPADDSTLPVLDFAAPEAFAPAAANLTVANLGGDLAFVLSAIFTTGAPSGATIFLTSAEGASPFRYYGIPGAHRVAGDLHLAAAVVFSADEGELRFTGLYFEDPIDRSVTLGSPLPVPQLEVAAPSPHLRVRASGSLTSAYDRYVRALFSQPGRSATIEASAAYLSQATTYDLVVPDFTGVAGWLDEWGLTEGVIPTAWFVRGVGFTGEGVSRPVPAEGVSFQFAERFGTLPP